MHPPKFLAYLAIPVLAVVTLVASSDAAGSKSQRRKHRSISQTKPAPRREKPATIAKIAKPPQGENGSPLRQADDPEGRKNWFFYQRMYPFGEIPADARRHAWDQMRTLAKGPRPEAPGTTWNSIGPTPTAGAGPGGNVSGRINAIAVSPANTQIILVAGATGGIWRSTDGGTNFTPVSDSQVDIAVGTIAFAPSNANIVYAGMGDNDNGYFGTGVLKSTDAGATWTRVNNNTLPDRAQSTKIQVDPADPNKVYLAQINSLDTTTGGNIIGGIYVSTDGGVNWTRTLTGLASDLVIHPTNAQIIYGALRFGTNGAAPRGLFKSTDGGQTWNNVFASPFTTNQNSTRDFRVAVTPAAPDRVYIYFGTENPRQVLVEQSDNAGATFTSRGAISNNSIDPGQFGYNTYLAASPADANTIYVGCRDTFSSTDGGVTFTNLNNSFGPPYNPGNFTEQLQKIHTDQQSFAFQPGSATTFYAGNDGGIFKTTDSGATFTSLNNTLSLVQLVSIQVNPTDATRSYGGAQDNGSQRRTVNTNGWVEFVGGDGGKVVTNPLDPSMVFPSNTEGSITRVTNNGTGAQAAIADATVFGEPNNGPRIGFYPPIVTNGIDAKLYSGSWRLFICSDCNDLNKSLGGNNPTWTAPGGMFDQTKGGDDIINAIAVARSNNNIIYTGSRDGRAMRSADGGANWTDITTGLPDRTIANITVSATDPTLVYLTVSGYGSGHVFRSTNSGGTWTDISNNLPNIPTSAFLIDPTVATLFYAGTDLGVFRSTDSGATWTAFNNGLPPVPVMAFSAQAGGLIQVGTYGRGAYELPTVGGGGTTVQFSTAAYTVNEGAGTVTITVNRSGDTSGVSTVDYKTQDTDTFTFNCATKQGQAYGRCDFATVVGTASFAAGETSKTFTIPIINDGYAEGDETFSVVLSNPTGATLGAPSTATVTINDNETTDQPNPILQTNAAGVTFFVRQQYLDFLGREPEGGEPWSAIVNGCADQFNTNPLSPSANCDRILVSGSFFGSPEFKTKGFYVINFYRVAFNRRPTYTEFSTDLASVVGTTAAETFAKRAAYANNFILRPEFTPIYGALTNTQFVNALMGGGQGQNYNLTSIRTPNPATPDDATDGNKVVLTTNDLINALNGATLTKAQVLRAIVQSDEISLQKEAVNAFVASQYYGYLRRTPDTAGFNSWFTYLTNNPNDFRTMINGFLNSNEYRLRFGP